MPGGRPRKPTHLHIVTGTARRDRTNTAEPQPARAIPSPPAHLRPRALAAWRNVAQLLDDMGVLTVADGLALERLCECYADLLEARESLAKPIEAVTQDGQIIQIVPGGEITYLSRGKDGYLLRARPELALIADADRRLKGYFSEFGLTPAARTKVKVAGMTQPDDPLAQYLS